MTDTVIKGSGNSRSIKTVPNALTMYPTHEAMIAAMVDGTFPIDLGPLNDAGIQTRGMDLNKSTLLKDATAALYGLGDNASPDDVLAEIAPYLPKIGEKAQIETGSYAGDGTSTKSLTFSGVPYFLFVSNIGTSPSYTTIAFISTWSGIRFSLGSSANQNEMHPSVSKNTISWSESTDGAAMNIKNRNYKYVAFTK